MIIGRDNHPISRANIAKEALKVLYRLKDADYEAYLVGGGVRDLLLGLHPKDFDVATNAHPEEVAEVFNNCRLIGRRFRLAHVHFGREIIEVATFRSLTSGAADTAEQATDEGMVLRDNEYGTIEEDALRRDFTVNALYYNIRDFSIVDYAGGVDDLNARLLRLMGDPETRYREDPVRMIRAVRFAAKLGFTIEEKTEEPIRRIATLLNDVPPARMFEEVLKLFLSGHAQATYNLLQHYHLLPCLFPDTAATLKNNDPSTATLIRRGMENTDSRIHEGKPVTPAFLFAVLLWGPVRDRAAMYEADDVPAYQALHAAVNDILDRQLQRIALPRRFSTPMREIWSLQHRFLQTRGKRPLRLLSHPRFRAAYDFMLLRSEAGEVDAEVAQWWTEFQVGKLEPTQHQDRDGKPKRRRRRRNNSKKRDA